MYLLYTIVAFLAVAGALPTSNQPSDIAATESGAGYTYRVDEQHCIVKPTRFAEKPVLECHDPDESDLSKRRSGGRGGRSGGSGSPPKGSLPKPHIDLNFHITGPAPGTKEDRVKSSSTVLEPGKLGVGVALFCTGVAMIWW